MREAMDPDQAARMLDLLAGDEASIKALELRLAMQLAEVARALRRGGLARRLLEHAERRAVEEASPVDVGWARLDRLRLEETSSDAHERATAIVEAAEVELASNRPGASALAAAALNTLAKLTWAAGDLDAARSYQTRSLRLKEDDSDVGGQINSLSNLAAMARAAGDEAAAMSHTGRRLDITSALGEDPRHMDALADHAHDLMRRGAFQDARRRYGESLDMARRLGDLQGTLVASWGLADLAELEGDEEDAMLHLSRVLSAYLDAGQPSPDMLRARIDGLTGA